MALLVPRIAVVVNGVEQLDRLGRGVGAARRQLGVAVVDAGVEDRDTDAAPVEAAPSHRGDVHQRLALLAEGVGDTVRPHPSDQRVGRELGEVRGRYLQGNERQARVAAGDLGAELSPGGLEDCGHAGEESLVAFGRGEGRRFCLAEEDDAVELRLTGGGARAQARRHLRRAASRRRRPGGARRGDGRNDDKRGKGRDGWTHVHGNLRS